MESSYLRELFRTKLQVDDATWQRGRGFALINVLNKYLFYKDSNLSLTCARYAIRQLTDTPRFSFLPVKSSQRALLSTWFLEPHIKEWMHGIGLQNTLDGLEKFFQKKSSTTYWIGYDKETPFAFLITSPLDDGITLDCFICERDYLGKGVATIRIKEFILNYFPFVTRVLIDPEVKNTRAIHVYQKVGFKIIGEFLASWHPVPHFQMELYLREL